MEIIIIIAVLVGLIWWLFFREAGTKDESPAPYKVETPAPAQEVKAEEPAPAPVVEEKVEEARVNPVALALDVDPVVLPAKKPRKPRAPKAEAPAKAKATKPAKEKAAKPKKAAAMTATAPKKTRSKKA